MLCPVSKPVYHRNTCSVLGQCAKGVASRKKGRARRDARAGFSLVEVMVGTFVFSIIAAGIASSTSLCSRLAIANIYQNTATTVVQGYAEQIKSIRYEVIEDALADPSTHSIPTMSLSSTSGTLTEMNDPLIFGVRSEKNIVVDIEQLADGSERERIMEMWVTPTGTHLAGTGDNLDAIEITLYFEWMLSDKSITRSYDNTVKIVKTAISEF